MDDISEQSHIFTSKQLLWDEDIICRMSSLFGSPDKLRAVTGLFVSSSRVSVASNEESSFNSRNGISIQR